MAARLSPARERAIDPGSSPGACARLRERLRALGCDTSRALLWSMVASVLAQASGFVMNVLLARALGRTGFGEWAAVQNTVGTISGIAQLSMSVTAVKYVAQYRESRPDRVGVILGLCSTVTLATGLLASSLVLVTAPWLARSVLDSPGLEIPVQLAVGSLFLLTVNGFQVGALAGLERFRTLALAGAAQSGAAAVLAPLLALRWGVRGALVGHAVALLAGWYLHRRCLDRELLRAGIRVTKAGMGREARVLGEFALPATLSGVAGMLGVWLSMVILVRSASGYAEMASLAVATTLRTAVLFPPRVIERVATPVLNNRFGRGDGSYARAFRRSLMLTLGSSAAVALPIALLASPILRVFGREFADASPVVVAMAATGIVEALTISLSQHFLSHTRMWVNLVVVTARSATLVWATSALVPGHAAVGAAWATLLAYGVHAVVALALLRHGPRAS